MKQIYVRKTNGTFRKRFSPLQWVLVVISFVCTSVLIAYMASFPGKEEEMLSPVLEVKAQSNIQSRIVENYTVSEASVIRMIADEFSEFGIRVVKQALDIAYCESRYDEQATHRNSNGSIDRGVFQVNSIHGYPENKLYAAWENISIAKQMYKEQGWRPWSCARKVGIR